MSGLKLTLPMGTTEVKIGQQLNDIRTFFKKIELDNTYFVDAQNRQRLFYRNHGMEFIFNNGLLLGVYLSISEKDVASFKGPFGCLDKEFFANSSVQKFYDIAFHNQFVEWFKDYPRSIDMVKDTQRLRYIDNPKIPKTKIYYSDLNAILRGIEKPINKQELLSKMMQRFEIANFEHKLNKLSNENYKSNCIKLINELEYKVI